MNGAPAPVRHRQELDEIRLLGRPLTAAEDLDAYQLLAGFERWPTCRTPWWQPTPNTGASALLDPCVIGIGLAA